MPPVSVFWLAFSLFSIFKKFCCTLGVKEALTDYISLKKSENTCLFLVKRPLSLLCCHFEGYQLCGKDVMFVYFCLVLLKMGN